MTTMRRAWWERARWFFLLYVLVAVMGVTANRADIVLDGWRFAIVISACAAIVGTAGTYRIVTGHRHFHQFYADMEFAGVWGLVLFEMMHGLYAFWLTWVDDSVWWVSRGAAHIALAVAISVAYRGRPVRTTRKAHNG